MSSLPIEMNYAQQVTELAPSTMNEVVLTPSTGSGSYQPSGVIKFDFLNSGCIDPSSIVLRFQCVLPSNAGNPSAIRCTPASAFFSKLEVLFGSSVVESIQNYNVVANMYTNLTQDIAMKYGNQVPYGWQSTATDTTANMYDLDGRVCNNGAGVDTISFAIPLWCLLSNASKMIPAFAMNQISLQLTIETLSNIFAPTIATPVTGPPAIPAYTIPALFTLQNIELTYNRVVFDSSIERSILLMPKLVFKSWSFTNSTVSVASGSSGQISLVYNQKLASIKSAFIACCSTGVATAVNGLFDAIDITAGNGDINIVINGTQYPSRSISTKNSLAYVVQSLRKALGNISDPNNNLSINNIEFKATATTSSLVQPAKCYYGIGVERMHLPQEVAMLAGVSSNGANITVNINSATATANAFNVSLILAYDALFEVDCANRDCRIRQ